MIGAVSGSRRHGVAEAVSIGRLHRRRDELVAAGGRQPVGSSVTTGRALSNEGDAPAAHRNHRSARGRQRAPAGRRRDSATTATSLCTSPRPSCQSGGRRATCRCSGNRRPGHVNEVRHIAGAHSDPADRLPCRSSDGVVDPDAPRDRRARDRGGDARQRRVGTSRAPRGQAGQAQREYTQESDPTSQ